MTERRREQGTWADRDPVLHHCADGHHWTDQGDGTVSPSWGSGGTRFAVADAKRCPEPAGTAAWGHRGPDCGAVWHTGGCPCGSDAAVAPACLKPPVRSRAWSQRDGPWGESPYGCWWVSLGGGPERPMLADGGLSCAWTLLPVDLETGERTRRLDSARPGLRVRRIDFCDWPAWLRGAWRSTVAAGRCCATPTSAPGARAGRSADARSRPCSTPRSGPAASARCSAGS
jgi:hypothetical protein